MDRASSLLISMSISLIAPQWAQGGETNAPAPQAVQFSAASFDIPAPAPAGFWQTYSDRWRRSDHLFIDAFGAPAQLDWIERSDNERYGILHDQGITLAKTVSRSAIDSLRDATVASLPLGRWEHAAAGVLPAWLGERAGDLFEGSIGNSVEQESDPLSFSYTATGAALREQTEGSQRVHYGVRPFSRYVYVSANFGSYGSQPLAITDVRYYVTDHGEVIRAQVTVPVWNGLYVGGGASFEPSDMRRSGRNPPVSTLLVDQRFSKRYWIDHAYIGFQFDGVFRIQFGGSKAF